MNAATTHTKSLSIKLAYMARTKTLGLADFSDWRESKKEDKVTTNKMRLPMITTSLSMPHLTSIFFPAIKKAFISTKTRIMGRSGA
jgi:hypothetical protein